MKIYYQTAVLCFLFFLISCRKKTEIDIPIAIQNEILLNDSLKETLLVNVINKYNDNSIILIDIWASWCSDCIKGLEDLKQIQAIYADKNISFLLLSVDEDEKKWLNALQKFNIKGNHFIVKNGWKKSELCNFLDVNWIPRYVLINNKGQILHFRSVSAGDKDLIQAIELNLKK